MTQEELLALKLRSLDLKTHLEVMGNPPFAGGPDDFPHYSTTDNAVRLVRNRIAELGLIHEFLEELRHTKPATAAVRDVSSHDLVAWNWIHRFTPQQQCIAAILAVQENA